MNDNDTPTATEAKPSLYCPYCDEYECEYVKDIAGLELYSCVRCGYERWEDKASGDLPRAG